MLFVTLHHTALRIVTGAFRTTPTASLLVEAHEPSLTSRRQLLGMRYAIRIRQFPSHPAYEAVFSRTNLALFRTGEGERSARYLPFCSRMQSLLTESHINLREVMRRE